MKYKIYTIRSEELGNTLALKPEQGNYYYEIIPILFGQFRIIHTDGANVDQMW